MKKIALIEPSITADTRILEVMPPLWALSLATYLREALPGVRVDIIHEAILGRAEFLKRLSAGGYDIAGFSPISKTYARTLEYARLVGKKGALVVLGGHYAPPLAAEIFANRGPASADHCVDAIVRYDGERALFELAKGAPFSKIKNLVYWDNKSGLAKNPVENPDLSELPPADYSLVDLKAYFRIQPPDSRGSVPFMSQRGCKWAEAYGRCMFCSIQYRGLRVLPPAEVVRRAALLKKKLGVRYLFESCDDFAADGEWLKELAGRASKAETPVWKVYARAASLGAKTAALLKGANVGYVSVGIESFSDRVLPLLSKGVSSKTNKDAISLLVSAGITPRMLLILGLPGESRESLAENLAALKTLRLTPESWRNLQLTQFAVYPGTAAWARLLQKERKYRGMDILDSPNLFDDWLKHFCKADGPMIDSARKEMEAFISSMAKGGAVRKNIPGRRPSARLAAKLNYRKGAEI